MPGTYTGLALLTPATVHHGDTAALIERRGAVLAATYAAQPPTNGIPEPGTLALLAGALGMFSLRRRKAH